MNKRRSLLTAAIALTLAPGVGLATTIADVLERPALHALAASKAVLTRIALAGTRLVAVGERGIVVLSDDNGQSWRQAATPVSVTLTGVQFVSAREGWAIGHAAVILHTSDGGESWALQFDGRKLPALLQARENDLRARTPDNTAGIKAAADMARQAASDGPDKPLLGLYFDDDKHGYVVGAFGLALYTDDGGLSWNARSDVLPNPQGLHLYGVARVGSSLMIAGEQGLVIRGDFTLDHAVALSSPYRGSFFALVQLDGGAALLAGLKGHVFICAADNSFNAINSGTELALVWAGRLPGGRILLADQSGHLLISNDSASAFDRLKNIPSTMKWISAVQTRDGALVGAGADGVVSVANMAANGVKS